NCADARYAYGTLCEGTPASALTKVHTVSITFVRLLNDYLGGGSTDFATTVNNLASAVTKLAAVGGRNFMMPNLPNLGVTPGAASNGSQVQQGLAQLTNFHNSTLAATIQSLEQNPNINIIPVDVSTLFSNAIANPANYGFTNVTNNLVPGAGTNPAVSGFTLPPGTNPNEYLFWDAIHPTARAHQLIAETALKTTTAIPEMVSI
ncbi:SGNH/GDSL hydrolase family protein, partial [Aerosakkonema funiforme]